MLKLVTALFMVTSLLSSSLWSMSDPSTNNEEIGITLGEIIEHIETSATYINSKPVMNKLLLWTLASVAIPGACPGILMAGISCDNYFKPFLIQFNSSKFLCPFGLGACAVPLALGITTLGTYTALKIINFFYKKNNIEKQQQYKPQFSGRERETVATYDDILVLGSSFFASKSILSKLNTAQALALVELNLIDFGIAVHKFSGDANIYGNKLLRMLGMDMHSLATTLNKSETTAVFLKHPTLWQALVRSLSENIRSHQQIKRSLTDVLGKLLKAMNRPSENVDDIYNKILNHEVSLDLILASEIIILDVQGNDVEIDLVTDGGVLKISRQNLARVSGYFEKYLSHTPEQKTEIDVRGNDNKNHLQLAIDIAMEHYPDIAENNVLEILQSAHVMQIPWGFQECDKYIEKNKLFDQVFKESKEGNNRDLGQKLAFCKKYQLNKNRKNILVQLDDELSAISNTDLLDKLNNLKYVEKNDFKFFSNTEKFLKKNLAQDYFLIAISNYCHLAFIKKLLAEHFATRSKADCDVILEKIFVVVPEDLVLAIDEARNKMLTNK